MKAQELLRKVKKDYTLIADDFSSTRPHAWPEFSEFVRHLPPGSSVLDVGCGNGRLASFLKTRGVDYIGIDNNRKLLSLAKKDNPDVEFQIGDILKIPFPPHRFDSVWCIAVLHHIPTYKLQLQALRQLKRCIKKGGRLMLTVWNLWQPRYRIYIDRATHESFIPWKLNTKVERYYYAFTEKELRAMLKEVGFNQIRKIKSTGNLAFMCYEKN